MKDFICPKCGNTCDVTFTPYVVKNGKTIYPNNKRVFAIPNCNCTATKNKSV